MTDEDRKEVERLRLEQRLREHADAERAKSDSAYARKIVEHLVLGAAALILIAVIGAIIAQVVR